MLLSKEPVWRQQQVPVAARCCASPNHCPTRPPTPLAGAVAGCISRFVVGPLDVLKIRFQVQLEPIATLPSARGPHAIRSKYTGIGQALVTIFKEEGVKV